MINPEAQISWIENLGMRESGLQANFVQFFFIPKRGNFIQICGCLGWKAGGHDCWTLRGSCPVVGKGGFRCGHWGGGLAGKGACQAPRKNPKQKSQMYITDEIMLKLGGPCRRRFLQKSSGASLKSKKNKLNFVTWKLIF